MKKILLVFTSLVLLTNLFLPKMAFAEAAPKYIENPEIKEKPKLTLVEKKPTPVTTARPAPGIPGIVIGMIGTQILASDWAKEHIMPYQEKLNEIDIAVQHKIDELALETYDYLKQQEQFVDLSKPIVINYTSEIYNDLKTKIEELFEPYQYPEMPRDIPPAGFPALEPMANTTFPVNHSIGWVNGSEIEHIFIYHNKFNNTWSSATFTWSSNGEFKNISTFGSPSYTTFDDALNRAIERFNQKTNTPGYESSYKNYYDTAKSHGTVLKPDTIHLPPLPSYEEVPAIVEIDNTKYWEIPVQNPQYNPELEPSPENNPISIPNYVPVDDPDAEPIPAYIPNPDAPPLEEPDPDGEGSTEPPPEHNGLWDWLKNFLQKILDLLQKILNAILGLVNGILTGLQSLFIPDGDFFGDMFRDIKSLFDAKLPIIGQIADFFDRILDTTFNATIPEFLIDIPKEWGGGTYPIIDFSYFSEYRDWILNFIRFTAWFIFLKRLYNRIPRIIY